MNEPLFISIYIYVHKITIFRSFYLSKSKVFYIDNIYTSKVVKVNMLKINMRTLTNGGKKNEAISKF